MEVKFYTIGCPNCNILERKLNQSNIKYEKIEDKEIMIQKNMYSAPMLEVDGELMTYNKALEWLGVYNNEK